MVENYDKRVDAVQLHKTDKAGFSFTFDDIAKGLEAKKKAFEERTKTALTSGLSGVQNNVTYNGGNIPLGKSQSTDAGAFHG